MYKGKLQGEKYIYPVTLKKIIGLSSENVLIQNEKELIKYILTELKNDIFNKDTFSILVDCGVVDTVNLVDDLIIQLINYYPRYKYAGYLINYDIWHYVFLIMNKHDSQSIRLF